MFLRGKKRRKKSHVTHCAALVEGDCWEVQAFEEIFIGNTLTDSIFEENHLFGKKKTNRMGELQQLAHCDFCRKVLPHPAGAHQLKTFLCFVHMVLFLKV